MYSTILTELVILVLFRRLFCISRQADDVEGSMSPATVNLGGCRSSVSPSLPDVSRVTGFLWFKMCDG